MFLHYIGKLKVKITVSVMVLDYIARKRLHGDGGIRANPAVALGSFKEEDPYTS